MARKISGVIVHEAARGSLRGAFEVCKPIGFRCRQNQRPGFRANDVIGCDQSGAAVTRDVSAVYVVEDRVIAAEIEDQPLVRALAEGVSQAQAPRTIGATSDKDAIRSGIFAPGNFALPFFRRRSSASVTNSIIRS